jgi:hypothetical protein
MVPPQERHTDRDGRQRQSMHSNLPGRRMMAPEETAGSQGDRHRDTEVEHELKFASPLPCVLSTQLLGGSPHMRMDLPHSAH